MHFVVWLYSGLTLPVTKSYMKATAKWDFKLQNKDANPLKTTSYYNVKKIPQIVQKLFVLQIFLGMEIIKLKLIF